MIAPDYEPNVIRQYAASLYQQAKMLLFAGALLGAALGWGLGLTMVRFEIAFIVNADSTSLVLAIVGAAVGAWTGYAKGMRLRLEAQRDLCQVRIERNSALLLEQFRPNSPKSPVSSATARA